MQAREKVNASPLKTYEQAREFPLWNSALLRQTAVSPTRSHLLYLYHPVASMWHPNTGNPPTYAISTIRSFHLQFFSPLNASSIVILIGPMSKYLRCQIKLAMKIPKQNCKEKPVFDAQIREKMSGSDHHVLKLKFLALKKTWFFPHKKYLPNFFDFFLPLFYANF